ncbi:MAG: DNA methyltransferase [Pirellulales bacterium]
MTTAALPLSPNTIHAGDCLSLFSQLESGTVDLVFADPPFNIGYEYDEYHDRHSDDDYLAWCKEWMGETHRVLKEDGTFWLAIGDEYAADLKVAAERELGFTTRSWVVWYYTFGVNCTRKFSRSHAHLFHFVKDPKRFTFNAEDPFVRVPSARALVYGDKRANPTGRLPDDTWILRPQDLPEGFQSMDSTWYFARVAGTFKERQGFHGCQMPEQLLGRIIRVSSNPGEVVLDPFTGSGTTLASAKKLGRRWLGFELSSDYVKYSTERLASVKNGDTLDGPMDAIESAPSTANGRRLQDHPMLPVCNSGVVDEPAKAQRLECSTDPRIGTGIAIARSEHLSHIAKPQLREVLRQAIIEAFFAAHDGYSIDWLLANPDLQTAFHIACREAGLIGRPLDWNRELLRLRKSTKFPKRGKPKRVKLSSEQMEPYAFAAEIAWRLTSDRFGDVSLDEIICDEDKSQVFDRTAYRFAPGYNPVDYRWAALHLRKASCDLVTEMNKYQYVYRTREFQRTLLLDRCDLERYIGRPGIYSLLTVDKTHLFVDQSRDLGKRLLQHLSCNTLRKSIRYLSFIFPGDLPSEDYQGGLKLALVRRHQPQFNFPLAGL